MQRNHVSAYLSFTRKERTGIIAIVILVLIFTLLPFLFPFFIKPKTADHTRFAKEIAALKIKQADSGRRYIRRNDEGNNTVYNEPSGRSYSEKQPAALFYFDPNTLTAEGWEKLGLREKTISTIRNYISKGGRFYKPEDIRKIWGLHEDEVERLIPYVKIEQAVKEEPASSKNTEYPKAYERSKPSITAVDINTADSSAFIALPGIGNKLANRIIAFRDKLGGFYAIEQVAETYALPDSTFQKIKDKLTLGSVTVKKLDINTATVDELKVHPYIRYNIANAIVQYRQQHGGFASVDELKKIMMITEDSYRKLEPYLFVR